MKKALFSVLVFSGIFLVILLNSCASYKDVWLNPKESKITLIPNLRIQVDSVNIEKEFSFERWSSQILPNFINLYSSKSQYKITNFQTNTLTIAAEGDLYGIILNSKVWPNYENEVNSFYGQYNGIKYPNFSELPMHYEMPGITVKPKTPFTTGKELKEMISKKPNFLDWYDKDGSLTKFINAHPSGFYFIGFRQYYNRHALDGIKLINNYAKNNLVQETGLQKGSIEFSINKNYHKITNTAFFALSTLTVYTINLLGFPMLSQKASITVNAKIKNNKGDVIKEYSEEGIGKATSAMYWGYTFGGALTKVSPYGLPRTVNTFAINDALEKIRKKITEDHSIIIKQLEE